MPQEDVLQVISFPCSRIYTCPNNPIVNIISFRGKNTKKIVFSELFMINKMNFKFSMYLRHSKNLK